MQGKRGKRSPHTGTTLEDLLKKESTTKQLQLELRRLAKAIVRTALPLLPEEQRTRATYRRLLKSQLKHMKRMMEHLELSERDLLLSKLRLEIKSVELSPSSDSGEES